MNNVRIVRVLDFTEIPGARYKTDGDNSAEEFFEKNLKHVADDVLVKSKDKLVIDLDGTAGYPSSFVSELAKLMSQCYRKVKNSKNRILIKSDEDPGQIERFWNGFNKKY